MFGSVWSKGETVFLNGQSAKLDSIDTFKQALNEAAEKRSFPKILIVHTSNEPFWTETRGKDPGWHAVIIKGYSNGMVEVSNNWGRNDDHVFQEAIPEQQLYDAMKVNKQNLNKSKQQGNSAAGP